MRIRTSGARMRAALFVGTLMVAHAASAGTLILNNDEWTLTDYGFSQAPASTTAYAQNLATAMNVDGGPCNLLVHSNNFGLTGSSLNSAFTAAGCSVTYSLAPLDAATLSAYDGVLFAGTQSGYDAAVLTSYLSDGHSVYIAGGTGAANEDSIWDAFTDPFGLDFGPSYNGIQGLVQIVSSDPLFAGVTDLYFNNGNSISVVGNGPNAQVIASDGSNGLFATAGDKRKIKTTDNPTAVPEPATLALLGLGFAGLGFRRRKST